MAEKYSIEVSDEFVKISGTLTIREAFDFLNFFDREGYGILEGDEYGTALCMRRGNIEEERKSLINADVLENLQLEKVIRQEEQKKNSQLSQRVKDLEYLVQKIGLEGTEIHQKLKEANDSLQKYRSLQKLKNSPEAAKICAMEGPEGEDISPFSPLSEGTVE